ncbi:hypothetical protein K1T71_005624 [Dendrolimus kikuchii]|uniref:Uncharacterized protein n=1 Tax=Dendrolimus kikuchii TaxID=765133 RepID=A0ACC1D4J0_9NEOP|nr:hypothetical protein K1T71_005624 [Dendrolimus kikuchii]
MLYWISFVFLFVTVCAQPRSESEFEVPDQCAEVNCVGEEYQCINGQCYCADGYILNHFKVRCVRCPGLGDKCFGPCCNRHANGSLYCWQGICQPCYDPYGNWICRDPLDQILLISSTQIIMGATLILGIIASFILLYKLCAVSSLRPLGNRFNGDSRLSIGSLQLYVEERLRDAPPRYSRTPASGSAIYPAITYLNSGFIHDSSIPPPPYTPESKSTDVANTSIHI